jgi:hypothetical protein
MRCRENPNIAQVSAAKTVNKTEQIARVLISTVRGSFIPGPRRDTRAGGGFKTLVAASITGPLYSSLIPNYNVGPVRELMVYLRLAWGWFNG